ncbi:MAG: glutaredoxin family protein [Promethearchaeota archaeon]
MSEIFSTLEYTSEGSKDVGKDICVYALSTCGFCRRALQFLRDSDCKFKFIYVDKVPYETKQEIKEELKKTFSKRVVFPYCVVDDKEVLVGFVEEDWKQTIGL